MAHPTERRALSYQYNPTTSAWEEKRGNAELTIMASAARTITPSNSADQINYNWRGFVLFVNVTARASAVTLTPSIQSRDPVGGDYITVWTAAAAINTADGSVAYLFYPSPNTDAGSLYTEEIDLLVSRTWRVRMVHSTTGSITYSVAASMLL